MNNIHFEIPVKEKIFDALKFYQENLTTI